MRHSRCVIFFHALTIVVLQFIPDTIILAAGVPGGGSYYRESFIYDFSHLWGMGALWFPPITVFSFISLCFAFLLLIWDRQWSKIVILSTSIPALLLVLISIIDMIRDLNRFSVVLVIIFVLLISEIIFTAVSMKKTETKKQFYIIVPILCSAVILGSIALCFVSGLTYHSNDHMEKDHAFNLYQIKDNTEVFLSPIYMDDKDRDKIELLSKITNESDRCAIHLEQPDYMIVQMNNDDSTIEDSDNFTLNIWLKDGFVYSEIMTDMIDSESYVGKSKVTEREFIEAFLN